MNIKDRSNGTEGSIQSFGAKHLITSDRTVAQAGSKDGYCGDGRQCDAQPAEFQGSVNQTAPAVKAEKSATSPITARPTKTEGFTGVRKAAGVASHPGLMRAHQTGSVSHEDHKTVHGRGTEPVKTMSKSESAGSTMPTVAKLQNGYADLGKPPVEAGPVTARPTSGMMRAR
jgi:hypothetical protein